MKTRIVRIGNSQGVRIPKVLLEEAGLAGDVELRVDGDVIVIEPASHPREGWADAARKLADEAGESGLLDAPAATDFDVTEWAWDGEGGE